MWVKSSILFKCKNRKYLQDFTISMSISWILTGSGGECFTQRKSNTTLLSFTRSKVYVEKRNGAGSLWGPNASGHQLWLRYPPVLTVGEKIQDPSTILKHADCYFLICSILGPTELPTHTGRALYWTKWFPGSFPFNKKVPSLVNPHLPPPGFLSGILTTYLLGSAIC